MANILLVDDDVTFTKILNAFLIKKAHSVQVAHRVKDAIHLLDKEKIELLLLDYRLPDGTGLDILSDSKEKNIQVPVLIMTSFNDVRTAVKAMRMGAFDYITKPINQDELLMSIENALDYKREDIPSGKKLNLPEFIKGESVVSKKLQEHINLVGPTDMSVIIQGESGTGKELVARSIHQSSKRHKNPFVAIDCGALSKDLAASELFGHIKGAFTGAIQDKKGKFEEADGGTLFLDEIGNLSYEVQVKLLRALQERIIQPVGGNKEIKVDVRILAATNDDLLNSVKNGEFREDLHYRLNEFKIKVPPLRQRGNDLQIFIDYFIRESNQALERNVKKLSPEVMEIFKKYDWPGNLRELKNVVKRLVLLTNKEIAGKEGLPEEMLLSLESAPMPESPDLKALQETREKELIRKTLEEVKYNKTKAAKLLNINRSTLYCKMEKYGIDG